MIDLKGMISIQLLKKEPFTGSDGELRYRLYQCRRDEQDQIAAAYWFGKYCWDATKEEEKTTGFFPFSQEGIGEAVDWLNHVRREGGE